MKYYLLVLLLLVSHFELYAQKGIGGEADGGEFVHLSNVVKEDLEKFVTEIKLKQFHETDPQFPKELDSRNITLSLRKINQYFEGKDHQKNIQKLDELNKVATECQNEFNLSKVIGRKELELINNAIKNINEYYKISSVSNPTGRTDLASMGVEINEWSRELQKLKRNIENWNKQK